MSLLSQQSQVNADTAFFAPASGGGGGGGVGPNPSFSSISFPPSATISQDGNPGQITIKNGTTPGVNDISFLTNTSANGIVYNFQPGGAANLINLRAPGNSIALTFGATDAGGAAIGSAININGAPSSLSIIADTTSILGPLSVSTISVSSINGTSYPPSQSDVFSTIQVSSINGSQYPPAQSDVFSTIQVSSINGSQYPPAQSDNFTVLTIGGGASQDQALITLSTIGPGGAPNDFLFQANSFATNIGVQGAAFKIQSDTANSKVTINNGGTPANATIILEDIGTINSLNPVGAPTGVLQTTGVLQAGYADSVPYTSTILFPYPYPDDKVSVYITPTNAGISGGANPNVSLAASFGTNGVSSIGFSVDTRNGGVGYNGSFYWMAFPLTN